MARSAVLHRQNPIEKPLLYVLTPLQTVMLLFQTATEPPEPMVTCNTRHRLGVMTRRCHCFSATRRRPCQPLRLRFPASIVLVQ